MLLKSSFRFILSFFYIKFMISSANGLTSILVLNVISEEGQSLPLPAPSGPVPPADPVVPEPSTPPEEPPVEYSSSSESLYTFRTIIAAANEAEIYDRIRALEALDYYGLPPQTRPGEYEAIV